MRLYISFLHIRFSTKLFWWEKDNVKFLNIVMVDIIWVSSSSSLSNFRILLKICQNQNFKRCLYLWAWSLCWCWLIQHRTDVCLLKCQREVYSLYSCLKKKFQLNNESTSEPVEQNREKNINTHTYRQRAETITTL